MSALAAGHGSAARRGYSNAAVAYFVALAFGLPALVEQRRSQSENLSQLVYRYSHHRYVELFGRSMFTFYAPTLPSAKT